MEVESVIYVTFTSDSCLKKEVQTCEDSLLRGRISGIIKVCEKLGPTVRDILANPNPWAGGHCGRLECPPCKTVEGSCRKKNVVYSITCLTCMERGDRSVYHGESSRTLYERFTEHWEGLRQQTDESVLTRHWRECHGDRDTAPGYSVKISKVCSFQAEDGIRDALLIENEDSRHLINNKSEWGQNPVPRQATEFE